ncbi:MAG: hypothetical protein ACNYZH_10215, partial [Acidimicrobiia bacterium]
NADTRSNTATATQQLYDFDSSKTATADGTKGYSNDPAVSVDFSTATITHIDEEITVTDDYGTPDDASDDVDLGTVSALTDDLPKTLRYQRTFAVGDFPACGDWSVVNTADFVTNDTFSTGISSWTIVFDIPCDEGLTPGFWQGGAGLPLWDEPADQLAIDVGLALFSEGYGSGDPFYAGALYDDMFDEVDGRTLLEIVGSGGGSDFENKAKRDMIAALLNSVDVEVNYPYSVATILYDFFDVGDYVAFHTKYAAANELGGDRN